MNLEDSLLMKLIFMKNSDICKIIFAILLPPLGVFLERGCGADLLINICLTILGYIPGIIHALSVHLVRHQGTSLID
jgi:uncharacterized membrane protein YqaE (UPF0057 family)